MLEQTEEWLLVSENPDAPLAKPVVLGLYLGIGPRKLAVQKEDFEKVEGEKGKVKGGYDSSVTMGRIYKAGANRAELMSFD